jgi:hypothetical protein
MRYTYDVLDKQGNRRATHSRHCDADLETAFEEGEIIRVWDNLDQTKSCFFLRTEEDSVEWNMVEARNAQWSDKKIETRHEAPPPTYVPVLQNSELEKKDHINPSHYQGYFGGIDDIMPELQWLEAKQYQGQWKDPALFKAAVLLQADKYQSRLGGKDEEAQEILKSVWYLRFYAAYVKNGNKPIRVIDIPSLLGV